jgi:hypothetical protein
VELVEVEMEEQMELAHLAQSILEAEVEVLELVVVVLVFLMALLVVLGLSY